MKPHRDYLFISSKYILVAYIIVAIFGPLLANDRALLCIENGKWSFPAFQDLFSFRSQGNLSARPNSFECSYAIFPLIKYKASTLDRSNQGAVSPFAKQDIPDNYSRHWLGTDKLGRDIAAGIIYGTRTALLIAFFAVLISLFFGTFIGLLSGYFLNSGLRINIFQLAFLLFLLFFGTYYFITEILIFGQNFWFLFLLILILIFCIKWFNRFINLKTYAFPLDFLVLKIIELRKSIPGLFLILAFLSLFRYGSVWNIIIIASILGWTEFARFARAETLAIKEENYILSAKAMGYSDLRIMFKHILPNIAPTLIIVACFSAAGTVLLESTLSFLGIGLAAEDVSWGKILAEGRNLKSWWLVVFPGGAIFFLILSLNVLSDRLK